MEEIASNVEELNQQTQEEALTELMALLVPLIAVVTSSLKESSVSYTGANGKVVTYNQTTIKQTALRNIMSELNRLEKEYANTLYEATLKGMKAAVEETVNGLSVVDGIDDSRVVDVEKELAKKPIVDPYTLEQRIKRLSAELSGNIRTAVRQAAFSGEDANKIIALMQEEFGNVEWQVVRVIESEIYNAYRYQFGKIASNNGFDWLRIHESFPRHPRRKKHKCYPLANTDKYGKGKGVYKSTDIEIFYPHPQCTSWLELVEAMD